jgi:hypothetical protein
VIKKLDIFITTKDLQKKKKRERERERDLTGKLQFKEF